MEPLIRAENLTKIYISANNRTAAVTQVSLSVNAGEIIAITGPSGCGKTTLLNLLGLVLSPSEGHLYLNGTDTMCLSERKRADFRNAFFGYIVQDFALIEEETAYENIEIPFLYSKRRLHKKEQLAEIEKVLDRLGLKGKLYEKVKNLSGGQRQRVAIARAIINQPKVILADEPTGALDVKNSESIFSILHGLAGEDGRAVVMVTHNEQLAERCTRKIEMLDGHFVEQ